jgi:hypothetical protein
MNISRSVVTAELKSLLYHPMIMRVEIDDYFGALVE